MSKTRRLCKASTSSALSLALILFSPGLECYAASGSIASIPILGTGSAIAGKTGKSKVSFLHANPGSPRLSPASLSNSSSIGVAPPVSPISQMPVLAAPLQDGLVPKISPSPSNPAALPTSAIPGSPAVPSARTRLASTVSGLSAQAAPQLDIVASRDSSATSLRQSGTELQRVLEGATGRPAADATRISRPAPAQTGDHAEPRHKAAGLFNRPEGQNDAKIIRSFLEEAVSASGREPARRAQGMRVAFAKYPEVLVRLAQGWSPKTFSKNADLQKTFPFADKSTDSLYHCFWKLLDELAAQWHMPPIARLPLARKLYKQSVLGMAHEFAQAPPRERLEILGWLGDRPFTELANGINEQIADLDLGETDIVLLLAGQADSLSIPEYPALNAQTLAKILLEYFRHMSCTDKREMILCLLRLPPDSSSEMQLAAIVQRMGPVMQKFFQLAGSRSTSPHIRRVMSRLLSQVQPFDPKTAKQEVTRSLGRPIDDLFFDFSDQPLAAGTIGQVHRAKLKGTGEPVVLKVRRPGIKRQVAKEITLLRKITADQNFANLVDETKEVLAAEIDFRREAANMSLARVYQKPEQGINAVGLAQGVPVKEDVLVITLAPGRELSRIAKSERTPALENALARLLRIWFVEAIFGSGFFHADLHPGNIFLEAGPDAKSPDLLTLIDFGNCGSFTLPLRRGLAAMMLSAATRSTEHTVKALEDMGILPLRAAASFSDYLQDLYRRDLNLSDRVSNLIASAHSRGFPVPRELLLFNRSKMFLEAELQDVNTQLKRDVEGRRQHVSANEIYIGAFLGYVASHGASWLISAKARSESPVTLRMIWDFLKDIAIIEARTLSYFFHGLSWK